MAEEGASQLGSASVEVRATVSKFKRDLTDIRSDFERVINAINTSADRNASTIVASIGALKKQSQAARNEVRAVGADLTRVLSIVQTVGVGAGLYAVVNGIVALGDEYTNLSARIRLVLGDTDKFEQVQASLFRVAQQTRAPLNDLVTLYVRVRQAIKGLGDAEARNITETLSKSLVISGAAPSEAAGFLRQISQALASGVLRGDEFNSVMENNARFARLLADQLGVSVGELRQMATQGRLTADVIRAAIATGSSQLDREFAQIPLTVAGAVTQLTNALALYVGQTSTSTGSSARLAGAISLLADNFHQVADAVALLGAVLVSSAIGGVASSGIGAFSKALRAAREEATAANVVMRSLQATTALSKTAFLSLADALGGPVGIALAAASIGFLLLKQRQDEAVQASANFRRALEVVSQMRPAMESAGQATNQTGQAIQNAGDQTQRLTELTARAAAGARDYASAQRNVTAAIQAQTGAARGLSEINRRDTIDTLTRAIAQTDALIGESQRRIQQARNEIELQENAIRAGHYTQPGEVEYARQVIAEQRQIVADEEASIASIRQHIPDLQESLQGYRSGLLTTAQDQANANDQAEQFVDRLILMAAHAHDAAEALRQLNQATNLPAGFDKADAERRIREAATGVVQSTGRTRESEASRSFRDQLGPGTNPEVALAFLQRLRSEQAITSEEANRLAESVLQLPRAFGTILQVDDPIRRLELFQTRFEELQRAAGDLKGLNAFRDVLDQVQVDAATERIHTVEQQIQQFSSESATAAQNLQRLQDNVHIFELLGAQAEYARALTAALEDMAHASGDAAYALSMLNGIQLPPDLDKGEAERRIRAAANAGQEAQQERERYGIRSEDVRGAVGDGLAEAFRHGHWKSAFAQSVSEVMDSISRRLASKVTDWIFGETGGGDPLGGLLSAAGSVFGGVGGFIGGLLGHRASGGDVRAGAGYTFNEQGQEVFFPGVSGSVATNKALREALSSSKDAGVKLYVDARTDGSVDLKIAAAEQRAAVKGGALGVQMMTKGIKRRSST